MPRGLSCTAILISFTALLPAAGCRCGSPNTHQHVADDHAMEQVRDAATATKRAPRLVVLLIVDQLPSWSFDRDLPLTTAGIRRLADHGVYYARARYPYASTYTAPGHAALATGAPPSVTGIIGNSWYRRDPHGGGKTVSSIYDPSAPPLRIPGLAQPASRGAASPAQLRVSGIGDALLDRATATGSTSKAISIALKSRAAVFALGKKPTLAVWYDSSQPAMTTSRYYAPVDAMPPWLTKLAAHHPISSLLDYTWKPRNAALLARVTGIADESAGEAGPYGLGIKFPYRIADSSAPAKALQATPLGDRIIVDTALAAVDGEQLGADDAPDVLAVSFSAHDYAGHDWGQESWERLDLFLRLDQDIGRLLTGLDQRVGKGNYAVVFTSDHGATRMVERKPTRGRTGRRIHASEIVAAAQRGAASVLGKGTWVASYAVSNVYMSDAFLAQPAATRSSALDAAVAAVAKVADIAFAARTDALMGRCEARSGVERAACFSLRPGASGDIIVAAGPNCLCTADRYITGTSHGSPNPDDTDVPIIVFAPGVPGRERRVVSGLVSPLQVAPTLARLLGVPPPPSATALPLQ